MPLTGSLTRCLLRPVLFALVAWMPAQAQTPAKPFPDGVFTAKTVAIVNDTKQPGVEKGADAALATWGQLKVVDDPQLADIVLRFEKANHHDGRDTHKTDAEGKPSDYGYEMSFSATISMQAYYKDQDAPFYSTKTEEAKTKAGTTCIDALHTAWRNARAAKQRPPS